MVKHAVGLLLACALLMWGLTLAAAMTDVRTRLFAMSLAGTTVTSLGALLAACVVRLGELVAARITGRLDRAYLAMAKAFIQQQSQSQSPEEPPVRLVLVRAGRARP
jgi:hypothetical protein